MTGVLGVAGFALADEADLQPLAAAPAPVTAQPPTQKPLEVDERKADGLASVLAPAPTRWLPAGRRDCHRAGRFRAYCNGPRRVPRPQGAAADLFRSLGLGDEPSHWFMTRPARPEWVAAVGSDPAENLLLPVAGARVGRGVGHTRRVHRSIPHLGVDIGAPVGTAIRAINDALVVYSDNGMRGYGNVVVLLHADGSTSLYAHCRETWVFPGQRVSRGQTIALVGVTGITGGPHLHFEYRVRGRVANPIPLFVGLPPSQQIWGTRG